MPVEQIRLGPFIGGLNTFSDPTAISDSECAQLDNFELDIDGSLRSRPPMVSLATAIPGSSTFGIDVLGFYEGSGGTKYLIASNRNGSTYYYNGTAWVLITSTFAATAMTQARDKAWLVAGPGSANPGGSWDPVGGFVADTNMPKGGCAIAHKDRVWIGPGVAAVTNGTRLYLSTVTAGTVTWPVTPVFLNVGAGDGQNIVDLCVYYDSLIIFKQGSTYSYSFSGDPATGEVRKQSSNVGAVEKGCVATFENQVYVVFDNKVYEFTNYNYNQLNKKVPLRADNPAATLAESVNISYWSDRLFVQFYDSTYVYSLKTGTWSQWKSSVIDFMGRVWPIPDEQGDQPTAYTYRMAKTGYLGLYQIIDAATSVTEAITCTVVTKNFDYQSPANFKALKGWGVDVISKVQITGTAAPVVYSAGAVTWDYLNSHAIEWDDLLTAGATWDRLIEPLVTVVSSIATAGSGSGRKFIKFPMALRFRQVGFKIEVTTNGDTLTTPLQLFNIVTRVATKEYMSKRIS